MKISIISASSRAGSQSLKVSEYLESRLKESGVETALIDLNTHRLPLYDVTSEGEWKQTWTAIESELDGSGGFIFVSPEWDGMFSTALHNLFNYVASGSVKNVMAHKPAMLVGVSSGMGGAYPIEQLRMVGPKNTHFVVSPENLRFAHVGEALVDGEITIEALRKRADYALKILVAYSEAFSTVRTSGILNFEEFGSGV